MAPASAALHRATGTGTALRLARTAWRIQYRDSVRSLGLAEKALSRAQAEVNLVAEAWARLARGFHRLRHAAPAAAADELAAARQCFDEAGDRAGEILAAVGIARSEWLQAKYRESLQRLLPLRNEGMRLLRHEARGMLLNAIAGCYSAQGDSAKAFAYMYEALRETQPARGHGFDIVLFCNLAHELCQLGDYDDALAYLREGIERCKDLSNPRLESVLLINRIACLTDLDRPREALPDIGRVLDRVSDARVGDGEGVSFDTMAIAALRAGEISLGEALIERMRASLARSTVPDEQIEGAVAEAELLTGRGDPGAAVARLQQAQPLPTEGLSLRVRCLYAQTLTDLLERIGRKDDALTELRRWQRLHVERMQRASQSRRQAASLKTELMRLQRERDLIDKRRRASERAQAQLASVNQQLSQKVAEVESLRAILQQQAVRDFLTGLFNRRHLNDVLPSMLALAQRDNLPLALAIIDLDHFKETNDRYGHLIGDRVLAEFGRLLAAKLRRSDIACRYGGEEFCLLLPRTDARAAVRKVTALLRCWREMRYRFDGVEITGNSFSAGIADSVQVSQSAETLLQAADQCVLEAKRGGRGRVVVYEEDAIEAPERRPAAISRAATSPAV